MIILLAHRQHLGYISDVAEYILTWALQLTSSHQSVPRWNKRTVQESPGAAVGWNPTSTKASMQGKWGGNVRRRVSSCGNRRRKN